MFCGDIKYWGFLMGNPKVLLNKCQPLLAFYILTNVV